MGKKQAAYFFEERMKSVYLVHAVKSVYAMVVTMCESKLWLNLIYACN